MKDSRWLKYLINLLLVWVCISGIALGASFNGVFGLILVLCSISSIVFLVIYEANSR